MASNKILAFVLCLSVTGCSYFQKKEEPEPVAMPDPKITQAWLDEYQPKLEEALKGSHFELERRENLLVVTAPVKGTFNPDRPDMLLPATLGPITRMAKLIQDDQKIAVMVLGHADSSGSLEQNRELSHQRARAFTAIFRLSGLKQNRLMVKGMGPDMPRAANDSLIGRELNRRVEILVTPQDTLRALIAQYSQPAPAATTVASADVPDATRKLAEGKKVVAAGQTK